MPTATQLTGPEIIGYKLKRNQKPCGKDDSCFDLQVFALNPISAIDDQTCYYVPGPKQKCNMAEESATFINLGTGKVDEVSNYSLPVFTRIPYLTEAALKGLDMSVLIRDLFVKKSFSFKPDYLNLSENPKHSSLTIPAKPNFETVYAQIFDEPFTFNKINGFQCKYEESVAGSGCDGNFTESYDSKSINGVPPLLLMRSWNSNESLFSKFPRAPVVGSPSDEAHLLNPAGIPKLIQMRRQLFGKEDVLLIRVSAAGE